MGRTTRQCHQRFKEACGQSALPYRIVSRCVIPFDEGRQNVANMCQPGRSIVSEDKVHALTVLRDSD